MIKAVVRFSGVAGSKWTELYYFSGSFGSGSLPFTPQMIASRLSFLHPQNALRSIRYSNPDGGSRASAPIEVNSAGFWPSTGAVAAQPGTYASFTMSSLSPLATRKVKFHGLATNQFSIDDTSGNPTISSTFRNAAIGFISLLRNGGGVIRCLTRGVTLGSGLSQVTQVARDATNTRNAVLTTQQNHGITVNQMVLIRGADRKVLPGLLGTFKALAVTATTITINYTMPTATVAVSGGCFVRLADYSPSAAITSADYHSIGTGKVREAFFDSRGARSAQKVRHLA